MHGQRGRIEAWNEQRKAIGYYVKGHTARPQIMRMLKGAVSVKQDDGGFTVWAGGSYTIVQGVTRILSGWFSKTSVAGNTSLQSIRTSTGLATQRITGGVFVNSPHVSCCNMINCYCDGFVAGGVGGNCDNCSHSQTDHTC